MKKTQNRKKLVVSTETVRALRPALLEHALGAKAGAASFSGEDSCMPLCAPCSVERCPGG